MKSMRSMLAGATVGLLMAASVAWAAGFFPGLPATTDYSGMDSFRVPADTLYSGGRQPQTVYLTPAQLANNQAAPVALGTSGTIAVDASLSNLYTLTMSASGGNTLDTPSNLKAGKVFRIVVTATGSTRTMDYQGIYKWASGTAPTLTTTSGYKDLLTFVCDTTSSCLGTSVLALH